MLNSKHTRFGGMSFILLMSYQTNGIATFIDETNSQPYKRISQRSSTSENTELTVGISDPRDDFVRVYGEALGEYALYCITIKRKFNLDLMVDEFSKDLKKSSPTPQSTYEHYLNSRYNVPLSLTEGVYIALKRRAEIKP